MSFSSYFDAGHISDDFFVTAEIMQFVDLRGRSNIARVIRTLPERRRI